MTDEFGDMRTEYGKSLIDLGEQDKNVVVLGADTTDSLKTAGFGILLFLPLAYILEKLLILKMLYIKN